MGAVTSGWSITSVDIPVAKSARYANGIEDLHDGWPLRADSVTTPFGMEELLARVRAALRRAAPSRAPVVTVGDLVLDVEDRRATRAGEPVHLTPTEWKIVEVLARAQGRLVRQTTLLTEVWGPTYERETHYLRVYLAQLRRKLEDDPAHPRMLITDPGLGYRLLSDLS